MQSRGCIDGAGPGHKQRPRIRKKSAGRSWQGVLVAGVLAPLVGCSAITLRPLPEHVPSEPPASWELADWTRVLRENVRDGLVDYEHLKEHREPLDRFLGVMSAVGPETRPGLFKTRGDRVAYWINAYNALVLRIVLERYPAGSMYELSEPDLEGDYHFPIDGKPRTLSQIKDTLNQEARNDVRVIFCLCAAARGCPPLDEAPYYGFDLERRLRDTARRAMRNENIVRVDNVNRRLLVWLDLFSRREGLIEAYERRYRTRGAGLLTVLNTMAGAQRRSELAVARGYKVAPIPFDRTLNAWKPGT